MKPAHISSHLHSLICLGPHPLVQAPQEPGGHPCLVGNKPVLPDSNTAFPTLSSPCTAITRYRTTISVPRGGARGPPKCRTAITHSPAPRHGHAQLGRSAAAHAFNKRVEGSLRQQTPAAEQVSGQGGRAAVAAAASRLARHLHSPNCHRLAAGPALPQLPHPQTRAAMGKLYDYTAFPLLLPFILLWLAAARVLSMLAPLLIFPTILLNRRLNAACPFIPHIFRQRGWLMGGLMRLGFETTYCMNVARRFLTIPLRRHTPDLYIVGFPKAGTTSKAAYLKLHPAIDGIDGLTWHEVGGWLSGRVGGRAGGWRLECVL